ncbi:hypothetical protein QLL95_gp1015 [Cotonvirus japonicus]|uniref:Uncharacterized protein n=1 Tax=Cotonvirus japonicus TaxID=2811091 RepID=A0ABM7NSG9_9VIRU|nr:hypothetical protein QLL95_gp1015 [Cotonvirus japonicus]BCS83108.1 hypothetical protein [Cotonvirus japonicus]
MSTDKYIDINNNSENESDSDLEYESDNKPFIEEITSRICKLGRAKDFHQYIGPAYLCESCKRYGCETCLSSDGWEARVRDQVFLCFFCLMMEQRRLDIG